MKNVATAPKPKVVQKAVKNSSSKASANAARPASTGGRSGIAMPTKSCNCGGSGSK